MGISPEDKQQLLQKLNLLLSQQEALSEETDKLRLEIDSFRLMDDIEAMSVEGAAERIEARAPEAEHLKIEEVEQMKNLPSPDPVMNEAEIPMREEKDKKRKKPVWPLFVYEKFNFEKFIGENLINKVGIVITVIGVSIGVKYAIDNQLLSPLTRIILGYMVAGGLLIFALKLKKNYSNFSAVLLSGAMASMYFVTFSAYSFYELLPQVFAFVLMALFTVFTVVAALHYDRQVIALIGLVGAYAVPFLLSDGSGRVVVLFSYMVMINAGILIVALKKYWKWLYYSSFVITWLVFMAWYLEDYEMGKHFATGLLFLSVFYVTFYLAFLGYKLIRKEDFEKQDIVLMMANAFAFFGLGYAILDEHDTGSQLLGLFTLLNAIVHFVVTIVIFKRKQADRNLFFFSAGLVLVFITIAVPVQLDGGWVTLLWSGEAALLLWIGRSKKVSFYEKMSYPLMALAAFSLMEDWSNAYGNYWGDAPEEALPFIVNVHFLNSILFVAAFALINKVYYSIKFADTVHMKPWLSRITDVAVPVILIMGLYFTFLLELTQYWDQRYANMAYAASLDGDYSIGAYDLLHYKHVWNINYTMFFMMGLSLVGMTWFRDKRAGLVCLIVNTITVLVFLGEGLYEISELRERVMEGQLIKGVWGISAIPIRYISLALLGGLVWVSWRYVQRGLLQGSREEGLKILFVLFVQMVSVWVLSSELLHWLDLGGINETYKLGLSLLWGVYALGLVIYGIWKKIKYLRIAAIVLFSITLVKLFVYDISDLNTLSKTIIFISLGVLLLIVSFLYHKYKYKIFENDEK